MRIAFYAPLKPPDHPVASGDRRVARLLVEALRLTGNEPEIASRLRSHDGAGDPRRQARLGEIGAREAERLLRRWRRAPGGGPGAWVTHHPYYQAPERAGPPRHP